MDFYSNLCHTNNNNGLVNERVARPILTRMKNFSFEVFLTRICHKVWFRAIATTYHDEIESCLHHILSLLSYVNVPSPGLLIVFCLFYLHHFSFQLDVIFKLEVVCVILKRKTTSFKNVVHFLQSKGRTVKFLRPVPIDFIILPISFPMCTRFHIF